MPLPHHWQRFGPVSLLLFPFSLVFRLLVAVRRALYRAGWFASERLPVPVIVVGNCVVGGTGKTPAVIWLVEYLRAHGWTPGIVSRGYGANGDVMPVDVGDRAMNVGDEPLLLVQRTGCPVWIGRDRPAVARALRAAHPECDVIVTDDGLQHYRLVRDIEIALFDRRTTGNGLMLPAGPWREPATRLSSVDAVLAWDGASPDSPVRNLFRIDLAAPVFRAVKSKEPLLDAIAFKAQLGMRRLIAVAGIANPGRFFSMLHDLGLSPECHAFPDHHAFTAADLDFGADACVLMTEKDAVKCSGFSPPGSWVVRADALPEAAFGTFILEKLVAAKIA